MAGWEPEEGGPRLTVGVMGAASGEFSDEARLKAQALGEAIARHDCVLVNGACPGLPAYAAQGAKAEGGFTIGISPAFCRKEHFERYGSPMKDLDVIIYTGSGFMGREVTNIRSSDMIVLLGGRTGTLGEFAIAYDEGRLIGVLTGLGGISDEIAHIVEVCNKPSGAHVIYHDDPTCLLEELLAYYRTHPINYSTCRVGRQVE